MRYSVFTSEQTLIGTADSAQRASDIACARLRDNSVESFAFTVDSTPGYVYPVTRYERADSGAAVQWIGTPFKTLRQCLANDDGSGYHVESWGGGRFTAIAWFASRGEALRERESMIARGAWSGMLPRVVAGTRERG